MYIFTKKEIRKQFKETSYGKKLNILLWITILVFFILFISYEIIYYESLLLNKAPENLHLYLISLSICFMVYFFGKRSGAIKQFEKTLK